jgi:hydrogenase maturation protease
MKTLVAGIGNIFFGDDGFGVEVANRLVGRELPAGVRLGEYGIRGIHLAYELLDGYDLLVLIDAVPINQPPGTVAVIEVDMDDVVRAGDTGIDAHTMTPASVLGALAHLGGRVGRVLLVGCQPESIDERLGLSQPVAAAVEVAVDEVTKLLDVVSAVGKEPGRVVQNRDPVRHGGRSSAFAGRIEKER